MKFRCERDDLLGAVQFASRAVSNRATLPVLSGLRIEVAEDGRVGVAATALELTMETSFMANVGEPGRTIVPSRLFGEMARSLSPGQVSVAGAEGEVEISSGRGQFHVKALAPGDYPALPIEGPSQGDEGTLDVDCGVLATALSQVVRAASGDESRQVLTGVLWEVSPGTLSLAATDSYRLAVRSLEVGGGIGDPRSVVLPARALQEVGRVLQGTSGRVRATLRPNLIIFSVGDLGEKTGELVIGSRLIEGEFPKYRQLIPEGYSNVLKVEPERLLEVVRRVGLLARDQMPVRFRLGTDLEVSAHTPDVGEGQEVLEVEYEGQELVIAFNQQFLTDGAAAIGADRLMLLASDGLKPALLRPEGDDSFTYLLMPVRLN